MPIDPEEETGNLVHLSVQGELTTPIRRR